ncbi:hypothetical protein [Flavobacterium lipolyticum]|uniref:Uncharacterized protein n=1 Tax=Flavobacterium lipolyticum TaxID=2893754 RepID=A0ABS8M2J8_9FLAO|nr:hypothetical protein [Flavobacterium sp. F-126]MCC9018952.1 hypothetical protein [Flavobacterium sp. F-126]
MSEQILNHIEIHIKNQISDYKERRLFKFRNPKKEYDKDNNAHIVTINIEYHDVVFCIGLKYQSNEIEFLSDVSLNHKNFNDFEEIYKFLKHFHEIDTDYLKRKFEFHKKK